jgi:hypothetical protein
VDRKAHEETVMGGPDMNLHSRRLACSDEDSLWQTLGNDLRSPHLQQQQSQVESQVELGPLSDRSQKNGTTDFPSIIDLDCWTAKLLRKQEWTNTHIADVWPVLMKIPYQEHLRALLAYFCHTCDDSQKSKIRSIIGQTILFRYTVHTAA